MIVALISAGPSVLQTYDPDAQFDLRIGVNSAAAAWPVDWWSCGDGETFARIEPIGLPAVYTIDLADWHLRQSPTADRLAQHQVKTWSQIRADLPSLPPNGWNMWSVTAAVPLAWTLGAKELHVYGHDMQGTTDFSGHDLQKRAQNWGRPFNGVKLAWEGVRAWAEKMGVKIIEHQPEQG